MDEEENPQSGSPRGHSDAEPQPGDSHGSESSDFPTANEILGTLFHESSLWPLLIVMLGSTGAFGAALIVLALLDRNPFAAGALIILVGMSIDMAVRARRNPTIKNFFKLIASFWIVAIALALVAVYTGIA